MSQLHRSRIVVASVAIACVSILSGCWHHRHDVVYVDRGHDDHRNDHHDEHHDHDEHR